MDTNRDYAFASGGIIWKVIDRPKFEARSLRYQIFLVFGLMMVCWLPIALLSFFQLGLNQFYLLFIRDIATHVRFLLVFPILLFARNSINYSFNHAINFFYETGIVDNTNSETFEHTINKLEKWKNAKLVDCAIIFLVYLLFFIQASSRFNSASTYAPLAFVR